MPLYQKAPPTPAPPPARRKPRQARSQFTVSALLEAASRVLLKQGYRACTTKEVAEVAGVGIGSLYEYFPNKEALIAAVFKREADRYTDVLEREMLAVMDRPFAEAVPVALRATLRELECRRPLMNLLLRESPFAGQLVTLQTLPARAEGLAVICRERWGSELALSSLPTFLILTNMLVSAYFTHVITPTNSVSSEAFVETLETILLKVLEPQERLHEPTFDAAE